VPLGIAQEALQGTGKDLVTEDHFHDVNASPLHGLDDLDVVGPRGGSLQKVFGFGIADSH
jgi:hypothetical protein